MAETWHAWTGSLSAAFSRRHDGLAAAAAAATAATVRQGHATAAVRGTAAMLRLGLPGFCREVATWLVKLGNFSETGLLCTAAVRSGAAESVQQLSWLLLSAPPERRDESLLATAEVTAAFWVAAAAEGWPAGEVANVMAPPVLQAIDAGLAGRVAAVQRMLFDRGLQPLLMWQQWAVVEERGRPDAAAEACWELMEQGSGHVVVEVSALVTAEGLHATSAAVSRELHALEREKQHKFVAGEKAQVVPTGREAACVLAAANVQAAEAGQANGVAEVAWLLYSEGQLDCVVDTLVGMAQELGRADVAGRIALSAVLRGRARLVVDASSQLLLRGHAAAAAAISAELYLAAAEAAAEAAAVGAVGDATRAQAHKPRMAGEMSGSAVTVLEPVRETPSVGAWASEDAAVAGEGPGGATLKAPKTVRSSPGPAGFLASRVPLPAFASLAPPAGEVEPRLGGTGVAGEAAAAAVAAVQHCPIAAAAARQSAARRRRAAALRAAQGSRAARQDRDVSQGAPGIAAPSGPEEGGPSPPQQQEQQPEAGPARAAPADAAAAAVASLAEAALLAVDGGAVQHVAAAVVLLWERQQLGLLRDLVLAMAAPPLSRPDAAAAASWAVVERGQGAAIAQVAAAVVGAGRVVEAARVMEDLADIAGPSPHLTKVGGDAILAAVHAGHAEYVAALTQALLDDGYTDLLNNMATRLVKEGHSEELGQVSAAALAAGQQGTVAELSAVLASPEEGEGSAPGALTALAGKTLKHGIQELGRVLKHGAEE